MHVFPNMKTKCTNLMFYYSHRTLKHYKNCCWFCTKLINVNIYYNINMKIKLCIFEQLLRKIEKHYILIVKCI